VTALKPTAQALLTCLSC